MRRDNEREVRQLFKVVYTKNDKLHLKKKKKNNNNNWLHSMT